MLVAPPGPARFTAILREFPELTRPPQTGGVVKHNVCHHIVTTGPPVYARPRRLSPQKLQIARQEFDHMLELGIIRPSSSPWASPLHMTGDRAGTIELSSEQPCPTVTRYLTFMMSQPIYMVRRFSQKLTSYEPTIKSPWL